MFGSTLILTISVGAITCRPSTTIPGARFFGLSNSEEDYSAYTKLVRVPGLDVPEIEPSEQLLRREKVGPLTPPGQKCGPRAFQSALSSVYGRNSIRSAVCAGYYGIARIRKTGTATSASLGFFAVDSTGRWRLVSTVPSDANVEESLPDGFPESLIKRWANR